MPDTAQTLDFEVKDLPMDLFELVRSGLEVESLTAGYMPIEATGQNCSTCVCACCSPSCCSGLSTCPC